MKISLVQLNYTIGAFDDNSNAIISTIHKAREEGADLIIFSELCVSGYPPLDLLEHRAFVEKCENYVEKIAGETSDIAVIIGSPRVNPNPEGKNLYNSAYFIYNGKIVEVINKSLLPTYDIFDESRYFEPGRNYKLIEYQGVKIAVTICEDLWYDQPLLSDFGKSKLYMENPMEKLAELQPDLVINIAASPFSYTQENVKNEILRSNAGKYKIPIIYVNQIGANTELIFDGASRVLNSRGKVVMRLKAFTEDRQSIDFHEIEQIDGDYPDPLKDDQTGKIHEALILGLKDYFEKMGFRKAILGLSGGIDSAVTCVLAVRALGRENVRVLLMPSKYSTDHSITDAQKLADNLGIFYDIISIREIFERFENELKPVFGNLPPDVAEENLQARIRGTLLMAVSNKFGNILLNTSNKSEAAVGYGTLYGDMNGGLSVLGDVYKTDVYKLAHYINRDIEIIPVNTIEKAPSAELRPDQKDTDSLPDYGQLDTILFHYIEKRLSVKEIVALNIDKEIVEKVLKLVNTNEYKRFQTPPILRISSKAFGPGRRMPLVAKY